MTSIIGIAVAAALVWVAVATTWLWLNQERVVFQPPEVDVSAPLPSTRVQFRAADGDELYGYLVAPGASPDNGTLVLAFHGNADLAAWFVPWAQELAERTGARILIPEYRGYGGLPGRPTYATANADALGTLAFARDSLKPSYLVLFGHSLGTAIATDLATAMESEGRGPMALLLQSPFTSAREMAARMLVPPIPWLWRRISRVHYDTRMLVSQLDAPVWVAHGTRDVVIPVRMGRNVFFAARHRGELLLVDGAGHNDVPDVGGDGYWHWIARAVSQPVSRDVSAGR